MKVLRYPGHDTTECSSSFGRCRSALNSELTVYVNSMPGAKSWNNIGEEGAEISPSQRYTRPIRMFCKDEKTMVFVLDKHKKPLMPCSEKRAQLLLKSGRAVVHRMEPFTIWIKDRTAEESKLQPLSLTLDPGAKTTGITIIEESTPDCGKVIYLREIRHKQDIKSFLDTRRSLRRSRRNRILQNPEIKGVKYQ